ncbi:MAG: phosphatidylinositol-specific phospholipase C1-like protein [Deltaproteobacteria bacterium]|nr:phosphatidylinositol-specific phospholipase C1-like protein [Deltaproteobacteria bacterium]
MRVMKLPVFRGALVCFLVPLFSLFSLLGCTTDSDPGDEQDKSLRMNEIQVLGTHNSYHIQPRDSILEGLATFDSQELADSLEYTALPLKEQFDRGVRQLEIDIFADPEGGLYALRRGLIVVNEDPVSGIPELDEPGLKVLHVQDIDFETHCLTFEACLTTLKEWSDANRGHLPIMVVVDTKDDVISDPLNLGFTIPLEFGPDELADIDREILAVFPPAQLITPDDVRGERDTLEEAVLNDGWLTLAEARERFMFILLNRGASRDHYIDGHPSLRGRVMFAEVAPGQPEAAWFRVDNSLNDGEELRELVAAGYLVRTRADADTQQAREDDYSLQEAAFASGGHTVSTDYVVPNPDFGTDYSAAVPGGYVARCNPISAPEECDSELIRP